MIARFLLLALLLITSAVQAAAAPATLKPPADRPIRVAFVMTEGATMIDFAGPWEVFQDVHMPERGQTMEEQMPFELFTVGASRQPIETSGGGKQATTHHDFYEPFTKRNPKVKLVRSKRYVQSDDVVFTAGGLTSGIDLALHVVELYFGRAAAERSIRPCSSASIARVSSTSTRSASWCRTSKGEYRVILHSGASLRMTRGRFEELQRRLAT